MKKPIFQALIQAQSNFVSSLEDFEHKILYLWIMIESRKPRSKLIRNILLLISLLRLILFFTTQSAYFHVIIFSQPNFSCSNELFGHFPVVNQWSENWIEFFFPDAGGLANGNMFGNFARWNEPSRGASGGESSKKVDYSLHVSQQPSNTGGGTSSSSSFSSFQQNTMTRTFPGESSNGRLHIQVLLLGETTDILSFFHILGRPY